VKGNGSSAYTAAVDGVDYLGPISMTGIIAYYPVSDIPSGWLRCDGSAYSRTTYARLFNIIGTTYGEGNGSTTFNVPNLYDYFIRCWDGSRPFNSVQEDQVGIHTHALSGKTGVESAHTHTRGTMNIEGGPIPWRTGTDKDGLIFGCMSLDRSITNYADCNDDQKNGPRYTINAANGWTGATSAGSPHTHTLSGDTAPNVTEDGVETRVLNKAMVPVIKY
jgi:hypothetical protein